MKPLSFDQRNKLLKQQQEVDRLARQLKNLLFLIVVHPETTTTQLMDAVSVTKRANEDLIHMETSITRLTRRN